MRCHRMMRGQKVATDPTQTTVLRADYRRAFSKRWRRVERALGGVVLAVSAGADPEDALVGQRVATALGRILGELMDRFVEETVDGAGRSLPERGTEWQNPFVREAYRRGARRAAITVGVTSGARTSANLSWTAHQLRLEALFERNFNLLRGITRAQAERIPFVLGQAVLEGAGADETARRVKRNIDVLGRNRSEILARTEIIRAHADGTLMEFKRQGQNFVVPQVEFTTAGDVRVCRRCLRIATQDRHGLGKGVFPVDASFGVIPVHPRCRCSWLPAGVGESPDERLVRRAREERRLDELQTSADARRRQREAQRRQARRERPVEALT